ncbi:MAG: InlB B-repeat-containing protein [Lachnospiraceae bacterium]
MKSIDDGETPNPEPEIYTVTFETNGGSSIESQAVEEGNTVLKPADPTKEGYTFDGWYSDEALSTIYDFGTPVTEDITLYAKWDEVRATIYTVTFETNGGNMIEPQTVEEGNTATKPEDPEKEGYTFEGWYEDEELINVYDFETPVTANITLYAKWDEVNDTGIYTVSFETSGGSVISDQAVYAGDCVIQPQNPVKEGYVFAGWYSDQELTEEYDFTTPVEKDFTLYAAWNDADVVIDLKLDTEDKTECKRNISGSITSNLTIEKVYYEFKSENKNEESDISLSDDFTFNIDVLLEDGTNTLTVYVDTVDGSTTSKSVSMAFDEGSTVDYSKVDQIYDPDDPRIVTKQYQSSVFHNPGSGSEEWMP